MLSLCMFIVMTDLISAQDSHYWTDQYGTEAQLIGGLVVGSTSDLSSTYYNPGAVALSSDQTLMLSTSAFELIEIGIRTENRQELDLNSFQTRPTPGIFAFRFWYDSLQINHLSLSVLTRRDSDHHFQGLNSDFDTSGITQEFSREYLTFNRLTETWFGLSFSHRMTERLGIGITQYLAVRSQRERVQNIFQLIENAAQGFSKISVADWKYLHFRLLWKAGLIYEAEKYSCGMSITTPGLNIYGTGSGYYNASIVGSNTEPELISISGEDMEVSYRSPFSIAVGAAFNLGNAKIYMSAEYFARIDPFNLMELRSADVGLRYEQIDLSHQMKPVFNLGCGLAYRFHDLFSLYGSVITNRSGVSPETPSDLAYTVYDIYHFSLGSSFSFFGMMLTVGIAYGTGPEAVLNVYDSLFTERYAFQDPDKYLVNYKSIKLLFGFSTFLMDD